MMKCNHGKCIQMEFENHKTLTELKGDMPLNHRWYCLVMLIKDFD